MNKEFEKILDRLDSHIEDAKSEGDFSYIKPFEIAKISVQEVAEESNNGWIPCSERLPEEDDTLYLVSYKKIFFDKSFYFYDIAYLYTFPNGNRYWVSAKSDNVRQVSKVSAWQPLPEQYKEG